MDLSCKSVLHVIIAGLVIFSAYSGYKCALITNILADYHHNIIFFVILICKGKMQIGAPLHLMDNYRYPDNFYGGIGGQTFKWVLINKPDWVTYSRVWTKGTGFYEIWLDYVKRKYNE